MRVLEDRDDISYAKVFFQRSGYITRAWAPAFLAARRDGATFDDAYEDGKMSHAAKRVYDVVRAGGALPVHIIRQEAGFGKEEKSRFERAIVELQMRMYITVSGRQQKRSNRGEEYGWASAVYCTTEAFWGEAVCAEAAAIPGTEAAERIAARVRTLNPDVEAKRLAKFIRG